MVNPIVAALGPVGGLAACACCIIIAAIWGLFATTIALAVYTSKNIGVFFSRKISIIIFRIGQWRNAIRQANGISNDGAVQMFSQALLIGILCLYGYVALRRAIRSAN
jgi:hypothetical protein